MDRSLTARLHDVVFGFVEDAAVRRALLDGKPLVDTAGLDSLTLVHLVVALENEFQIRFELDGIAEVFANLQSLEHNVRSQLAARDG